MEILTIRYLILVLVSAYAALIDVRTRLVPDYVWLIYLATQAPLYIVELASGYIRPSITLIILLAPLYALAILVWRYNLMGEADAIYIALLTTFFPRAPNRGIYSIPGILPLSILLTSMVVGVVATIIYNVSRNLRLALRGLLDFPEKYRSLPRRLALMLLLTPVEKDRVDSLKYLPGLSFSLPEPSEEASIRDLSYEIGGRTYVWASPGIPMLLWFTVGVTLHLAIILK
jgi:Flp pilus assembly protein protease CpaA